MAYGAANIMQPDNTFALEYKYGGSRLAGNAAAAAWHEQHS
jgi:hypothetical protein